MEHVTGAGGCAFCKLTESDVEAMTEDVATNMYLERDDDMCVDHMVIAASVRKTTGKMGRALLAEIVSRSKRP